MPVPSQKRKKTGAVQSFLMRVFVTQVGANWNELISELNAWSHFGRDIIASKEYTLNI